MIFSSMGTTNMVTTLTVGEAPYAYNTNPFPNGLVETTGRTIAPKAALR